MAQKIQKVKVIRPSIIETELLAIGRLLLIAIAAIVILVAAWHAHQNGGNNGGTPTTPDTNEIQNICGHGANGCAPGWQSRTTKSGG
jgi:hypothetical protein